MPVDVTFLLDSSDSIKGPDFEKEKEFIKKVADRLGISLHHSRAAVVLFSEYGYIKVRFQDSKNVEEFGKAVDNLDHLQGRSRLDRGLFTVAHNVFPEARDNVTKVLVVLNGDEQNAYNNSVLNTLKEASEQLRIQGVRIIAVGVSAAENSQLRQIAESDDDVVFRKTFGELHQVLHTVVKVVCERKEKNICEFPVDMAFIVVSPASLASNHSDITYFIKQVAKSITIPKGGGRLSIVYFGDNTRIQTFGKYSSVHPFYQTGAQPNIRTIPKMDNLSLDALIEKAFAPAENELRSSLPKAAMILIVGTVPSSKSNDLKDSFHALRRNGVRILPVGIGNNVSREELYWMSGPNSDVFLAPDVEGLKMKLPSIIKKICQIKSCDAPVDVAFVMDSSANMRNKYHTEKSIIKYVVKSLVGVNSTGGSRAGIVLYSASASTQANFEHFNGIDEFNEIINDLPLLNETARIDLALKRAQEELFVKPRDGVASVIIVFAGGAQDKDTTSLVKASESLRKAGVHIIAVGIGDAVEHELKQLTVAADDVIMSTNFEQLHMTVRSIAEKACQKAGPKVCLAVSDVVFVMDSSGSIGDTEYQTEKDFVKMVAESLGIAPNNSRVALVLYSDEASVKVELDTYDAVDDFKQAVDQLPYTKGRTRIDKALNAVKNDVLPKARPNVLTMVIVLTDGKQTKDPGAVGLKDASEPFRNLGVRILAVGVGQAEYNELRLMTDSDDDVILMKDFNELKLRTDSIAKMLCEQAGRRSAA